MSTVEYMPGHAAGARIDKDGEKWTLVIVRELKHSPERVWSALTDPAQLSQWAPYDADGSLAVAGATVNFTTIGAPKEHIVATEIKRAVAPRVLEFEWGGGPFRWELEPHGAGTKLTLWANINKQFIAMGAAGMHVCLDVMDRMLDGDPIGRMVGPALMQNQEWQRLHKEYAELLDVPMPKW